MELQLIEVVAMVVEATAMVENSAFKPSTARRHHDKKVRISAMRAGEPQLATARQRVAHPALSERA